MTRLAIVDLGSNSARMVVEELHDDGTYTEVLRHKTDTRISQGMGEEKMLQPEPIARTLTAIKAFQAAYAPYEVDEVRAITTAAVRTAANQAEFLAQVKAETGLDFQVLTGDEEAYYDYLGVVSTLELTDAVILDTGGASVEVIAVANGRNVAQVSLPFGAVNLSEKYALANEIKADNLAAAQADVRSQYEALDWLTAQNGVPIVLLGGANRSLAKMDRQAHHEAHPDNIHGYRMDASTIYTLFDQLTQLSRVEREKLAGLEASRADIIISGLIPLVNLMRVVAAPEVIFSESGVREGLIAEVLAKR
jgi:exopolyphosphatase/guanosine-5'-triphosphate,3'-diphosphate pyrophosphatase